MTDERVRAPVPGAVREVEEPFRLLVESVQDYAIFLLDTEGKVVSWNSGAQRVKGYTAGEIIGRHFSVFYPPEDVEAGRPQVQLRRALEQGRAEDEGWRVRKDGSRFWANAVITTLRDGDRLRGFAKVTRDLTERRQREEAERNVLLHEHASRLKDDFLAVVSHELRTPLNVILGEVWRLRHAQLAPEQQRRAWDALERNVRLQARIIDDLLDTSRIVSGKVTLHKQRFDLVAALEQVIEESRRSGHGLAITLRKDVSDGVVDADPARLHQIFANLLANAVKFTPSGGRIDVEVGRTDQGMRVSVRDTGIGIPRDFLAHVFDRFSQADSSSRRQFGGLGLGLSIVKQLVELHSGTVMVESAGEGHGATFIVTIPVLDENG